VLEELQEGDAIIVAELSRLGRSMLECMEILALATRKGIRVYSVKGSWQLDDSIQSKIIALAFSMAAEIERDLISQRTKEALRFKKEQGLTLGRPKASWILSDRKSRVCWRTARRKGSSRSVTTRQKQIYTTGLRRMG
jgi:DNA invertase Pin-like site-specific DNA recombinase